MLFGFFSDAFSDAFEAFGAVTAGVLRAAEAGDGGGEQEAAYLK